MATSPQVSWLFFKAVRAGLAAATSISEPIRKERATRKNSQLAAAQRVVMKMGRRLRARRLRINLDMRPLTASPARTALPAAHFDRNERYAYFGDRTPQ